MRETENVMLNLVQHLANSRYETLKQVQGDKIGITGQSLERKGIIAQIEILF